MAQVPIFENGKEIFVNEEFVEALIASKPGVYSKEKPEPKPLEKVPTPDMTKSDSNDQGKTDHLNDGQFTREDLEKIPYKELKLVAAKVGISAGNKKKNVLIDEILSKLGVITPGE